MLLVVAATENPFVPAPKEASFLVSALKEVVDFKAAVVAVSMVAVVPTEEPTVVFVTHHTLEAVCRNASQDPLSPMGYSRHKRGCEPKPLALTLGEVRA